MRKKLSIIIPCYNEAKNIPVICDRLNDSIIRRKFFEVELVIVNNGSSDESTKIIETLKKKYFFLKTVHIKKNIGYGNGIKQGLNIAKGEFLAYTHADLQTDLDDCFKAFEILSKNEKNNEVYVKGKRKGRSFFDNFFTIGMSIFETLLLKEKMWDINAQPNLFHKSFFDKIKSNCPDDFSLDLYFLFSAKKLGYKLLRFEVFFPPRIHGNSKWNTGIISRIKFIKRTISFSFKLNNKIK